jgi:hypothetical protein
LADLPQPDALVEKAKSIFSPKSFLIDLIGLRKKLLGNVVLISPFFNHNRLLSVAVL